MLIRSTILSVLRVRCQVHARVLSLSEVKHNGRRKTAAAKLLYRKKWTNVEVKNHELLKLAYDSYLANSRAKASATTKQRGEVRGVGKNHGNKREQVVHVLVRLNPIWRGGGVVFGPRG